jgi:hypothetical protein
MGINIRLGLVKLGWLRLGWVRCKVLWFQLVVVVAPIVVVVVAPLEV